MLVLPSPNESWGSCALCLAFAATVWLNDQFLNSTDPGPNADHSNALYSFSNATVKAGEDNILTVLQVIIYDSALPVPTYLTATSKDHSGNNETPDRKYLRLVLPANPRIAYLLSYEIDIQRDPRAASQDLFSTVETFQRGRFKESLADTLGRWQYTSLILPFIYRPQLS